MSHENPSDDLSHPFPAMMIVTYSCALDRVKISALDRCIADQCWNKMQARSEKHRVLLHYNLLLCWPQRLLDTQDV
jgi:hypothetical protein